MSSFQVMHKKCLLWVTLVFVCLNFQFSYAQQQKETSVEEVKAAIRKVIPALEALEAKLPTSGRGTATLKIENYFGLLNGKDLTVNFVFKGPNSRQDIYEWIGNKKGPKLETRIESEKYHIFEYYGMVDIQQAKGHDANRNDFHPSLFLSFNDSPLTERLQYILEYDYAANPQHYVSAELDDKGILHIINGRPASSPTDLGAETQMSFDTTRELTPILVRSTFKRPDNNTVRTVRLQWAQYDSTWYVSHVEYNTEPDNHNHRIMTIKDFRPNVNIWDREFTVDGLDLHNGMIVHNSITHTKYRYQEEKVHKQLSAIVNQKSDASPVDDPNSVLKSILAALKTMEHPKTGRGRAVLRTENYLPPQDDKDLVVDFVFKDQNSRMEIFEPDRTGGLSKIRAQIRTDKNTINTINTYTIITKPKVYDFKIGQNFHPETFFKVLSRPMTEWLEGCLENNEIKKSIELDTEGIFHLITKEHIIPKRGRAYDIETQIQFDPQKGMRPVYHYRTYKYPDKARDGVELKLKWSKYDSAWYISAFESRNRRDNSNHIKCSIESFTPNEEVSDTEFTLDGLNPHKGMLVRDTIQDLTYRYHEEKKQGQQISEVNNADSSPAGVLYLRSCKTGRLIGPVSLKPGSAFPTLKNETYIIAEPSEYELSVRKALLDAVGQPANFLDEELNIAIKLFNQMLKSRLGDKVPPVRIELGENSNMLLLTIEFIEEPIYETLCNIAAIEQLRIFIEDDAIILSSKEIREINSQNR